ncbi:dTDP-4-dehydrorhamnose reductase [Paralimibaculum aggregatum]|uniref:dTDP-4-dehydrorhamnose reductase n=1 Tax=Paralimibaculum aggregatum TaxID=3036245 RepID=A0ABQ6LCI8_9RHOB|nr:dTDP-4-dehydrorhamnose reductase [Limibaculum sp. NKW23]GMG81093.1 dTDP-4-dehydrorhamnose reductase [Limibaculum sp. NKW23]
MTRILVIGETGQLARALAEAPPVPGRELAFLGRGALDLADIEAIGPAVSAVRPDAVINAAAYTAVDRAEEETALAERINGAAVGRLAEVCAAAGAPLVHVSTDYVFDGSLDRPWREDDPVAPVNAYGASKLAGERAALAAGARVAVLRTAWVYAPWGANFLATMLRLAERERLTVVDDQHGCPTSALDLAAACLAAAAALLAEDDATAAGIWHYSGAGETSWAGFAEAIFAGALARGMIGRAPEVVRIPTADYPTPARRPANSRLDCSRFAARFGLAPRPWQEALAEVLDRRARA